MPAEGTKKSGEQIGTLGNCLIEGDAEQKSRERKVKRRAIAISIGLQSAALVALVVTPLLAKPEKISFNIVTPMPPYRPIPVRPTTPQPPPTPPDKKIINNEIFAPTKVPPRIPSHIPDEKPGNREIPDGTDWSRAVPIPGILGGVDQDSVRNNPRPPQESSAEQRRRIVVGGAVQQAMLVHRVDPVYPALAKNLHRSGSVHIRAVIATDGSIESFQLLDGDPLLAKSALEAVGQWRYRPTMLNGSPVEVETIITVVYTLGQ